MPTIQLSLAILAASLCHKAAADVSTHINFVTQYQVHLVNVLVDQNGLPYSTQTIESLASTPAANPPPAAPTAPAAVTSPAWVLGQSSDNGSPSHGQDHDVPAPGYTGSAADEIPSATPTTSPENTALLDPATSVSSPEPVTSDVPTFSQTTSSDPAPIPSKTTSSAPVTIGTDSKTFSGDATYYDVGLGACGVANDNSEFIAALNVDQFHEFGSMSNGNPACGKTATIHYQGKSVTVTIQDKCPGCAHGDLDLSPSAFEQLSDKGAGRIKMTWSFN